MTTPKLSHDTAWGRQYGRHVGDEPRVPSITTVQSMGADLANPKNKVPALGTRPQGGALTAWRARLVQDATAAYLRRSPDLDEKFPHIGRAIAAAEARGGKTVNVAIAKAARGAIAATPDVVANDAAERGDRVHNYAEAVGLWQLGLAEKTDVAGMRDLLAAHGEEDYARSFDDWWMRWDIQAVANEATVWNHTVGYAGTLDIVFRSNGRLFIGDYKSKSDRDGFAKRMQGKVGTQLMAGLRAEECVVDADTGDWTEWPYGNADHLLAIAVSPTEVVPQLINPQHYDALWRRFQTERAVWQDYRDLDMDDVLKPARPPATAANWAEDTQAVLPETWPMLANAH